MAAPTLDRPLSLCCPLPKGMRVVARQGTGETTVFVVQMALPAGVLDILSEALEVAARVTGSPRLGARITAVSQEFLGTWSTPTTDAESGQGADGTEVSTVRGALARRD